MNARAPPAVNVNGGLVEWADVVVEGEVHLQQRGAISSDRVEVEVVETITSPRPKRLY